MIGEKISSLLREICWQKTKIERMVNVIRIGRADSFNRYRGIRSLFLNIMYEGRWLDLYIGIASDNGYYVARPVIFILYSTKATLTP